MAAVACGALFKALLAALGGHKQPEKAAAVNQAGRWRWAALRGNKKSRNGRHAARPDQNRRRIRAPRGRSPMTRHLHVSFWCTWQKPRPY